ncbi:hypothetical protein [Actinoplanes aureus]|uniref:Uncharacterized protein n=1 Tax=Actinoplanes aureus TaxID=2792083 RepID=A0A931CG59_9ACTN|nr:hypothetical protein [Actinoplanes aureus]MBG0568024.1 hypothetical protein [Actinoplanes aureus]
MAELLAGRLPSPWSASGGTWPWGAVRVLRTDHHRRLSGSASSRQWQVDIAAQLTDGRGPTCTPVAVAAGSCDTEIQNIAAAMPAGIFLTYFHEPENDMTGTQFVPAFKRVYALAKALNPALNVVPIYMSYQWRPGSTKVTNNGTGGNYEIQDWLVPATHADAYGFDLYWQASTRGSEPDNPVSVGNDPA